MGKEEKIKTELMQSIVSYVRANHAEAIDKAYEYFWDEKNPDEFLSGTSLALGFMNFEDWLVFDYKANENKDTFIDIYCKNCKLKEEEIELLSRLKCSPISLYEVTSVSRDKRVAIKNLLIEGEFSLKDKKLTRGLKKGDIFGTRLLNLDKGHIMSNCVYPFAQSDKKRVLAFVDRMFKRYKRNEKPDGTMEEFLGDYGDIINIAWIEVILNQIEDKIVK